MMKRIIINATVSLCLVTLGSSCGPNQRILESANANEASEEAFTVTAKGGPAVTNFDQDLNAMRTADFKFIVVFRRKDGRAMDAADKELIGKAATQANRRRLSDEGKAVIIGTNFPFLAWEFKGLTERFTMENYSKPDSGSIYSNATPGPTME